MRFVTDYTCSPVVRGYYRVRYRLDNGYEGYLEVRVAADEDAEERLTAALQRRGYGLWQRREDDGCGGGSDHAH